MSPLIAFLEQGNGIRQPTCRKGTSTAWELAPRTLSDDNAIILGTGISKWAKMVR